MIIHDRAARVAVAIMDIVAMARGDYLREKLIRDLLRDEFRDERQQGVADRADTNP